MKTKFAFLTIICYPPTTHSLISNFQTPKDFEENYFKSIKNFGGNSAALIDLLTAKFGPAVCCYSGFYQVVPYYQAEPPQDQPNCFIFFNKSKSWNILIGFLFIKIVVSQIQISFQISINIFLSCSFLTYFSFKFNGPCV